MTGGRWIAAAWTSLLMLIVTAGLWTFSVMGDCPSDMICSRAPRLSFVILSVCGAVWATAIYLIVRNRGRL